MNKIILILMVILLFSSFAHGTLIINQSAGGSEVETNEDTNKRGSSTFTLADNTNIDFISAWVRLNSAPNGVVSLDIYSANASGLPIGDSLLNSTNNIAPLTTSFVQHFWSFDNTSLVAGNYVIVAHDRNNSLGGGNHNWISYSNAVASETVGRFTTSWGVIDATAQFRFELIGLGSGGSATFINDTPATATANNSQVLIEVNSSSGDNIYLFFGTESSPSVEVLSNVSVATSWLTNVTTSGLYYYKAGVYNPENGNIVGNTSIRTWTFDNVSPTLTLNPLNSFNISNVTTNRYLNLTLNMTVTDNIDLFTFQINITLSNGTVKYNLTNTSLSGLTSYNFLKEIDVSSWENQVMNVSILVSDSHTEDDWASKNQIVKKIGDIFLFRKARLEFDTTEGNNIRIESTDAAVVESTCARDRCSFEFEYEDRVDNTTRIHNVKSDKIITYLPNSPYQGAFIIWNSKTKSGNWLDFECNTDSVSVRKITDYNYEVTLVGAASNLQCNSIGGLNVLEANYLYTKSSLSLNSISLLPLSPTKFDNVSGFANSTEGNGLNVSYEWRWFRNGTQYDNNSDLSSNGKLSNVNSLLDTVLPINVSVGDTWIFSTRPYSLGHYNDWINSTARTVNNFEIGLCTNPEFNNTLINFTYNDDLTNEVINATNDFDLDAISPFIQDVQGSLAEATGHSLCTINNTQKITLTGTILIKNPAYATRLFTYTTGNEIVTNITNPIWLNLSLIRLNESSTVQLTFLTTSYEAIDGTLEVYSCDGSGTRTFRDSTPIINGLAITNLQLVNTPYSYEVIIDGIRYTDAASYTRCHIEADTARQFLVNIDSVDLTTFIGLYSVGCNLTRVTNNTVQMTWGTNPHDTGIITGCIYANRVQGGIHNQFYTNCTTTGSIERTIPNSGFNYIITGKVFQSGNRLTCNEAIEFNFDRSVADSFGLMGIFAIVLLIVGIVLIFSNEQPKWMPIMAVFGLLIAWIMGLTPFGWVAMSSLIAFVLIITWIGRYTRQST